MGEIIEIFKLTGDENVSVWLIETEVSFFLVPFVGLLEAKILKKRSF